ncbi:hypothetical protein H8959_018060 [Pygathrix nigripes]
MGSRGWNWCLALELLLLPLSLLAISIQDPVPKPVIKIEKREDVDDNCYLKLSCVIPGESVNYTWYGELPKEIQNSVLETTFKPHKHSKCYTCQVSNSVSSENGTVCFSSSCTVVASWDPKKPSDRHSGLTRVVRYMQLEPCHEICPKESGWNGYGRSEGLQKVGLHDARNCIGAIVWKAAACPALHKHDKKGIKGSSSSTVFLRYLQVHLLKWQLLHLESTLSLPHNSFHSSSPISNLLRRLHGGAEDGFSPEPPAPAGKC